MKGKVTMNKVMKYIQFYLILGFPFVIACMIWSTVNPQMINMGGFSLKQLAWQVLSFNLMLWFCALILFLISLIVLPRVREKTLCYLANIKERDEREEYITGKAARFAYLSNLGLLIFLLFFSIFSVNINYSPENPAGKQKTLQIGLGFSLYENKSEAKNTDKNIIQNKTILDSTQYSLSKTSILLILLAWQVAAFNLAARKEKIK